MKVWIGLKKQEEYVHESEEEVASEKEIAQAITRVMLKYHEETGQPLSEIDLIKIERKVVV